MMSHIFTEEKGAKKATLAILNPFSPVKIISFGLNLQNPKTQAQCIRRNTNGKKERAGMALW
jgi:hypothetical protein